MRERKEHFEVSFHPLAPDPQRKAEEKQPAPLIYCVHEYCMVGGAQAVNRKRGARQGGGGAVFRRPTMTHGDLGTTGIRAGEESVGSKEELMVSREQQ